MTVDVAIDRSNYPDDVMLSHGGLPYGNMTSTIQQPGTGNTASITLEAPLFETTGVVDRTISISATDTATTGVADSNSFLLTVLPSARGGGPLTVTTSSLADGGVGVVYSDMLQASGGTSPYTWSFASGTMPNGLTLSADGTVSGTPTVAGMFSFDAQVTDSAAGSASGTINATINNPVPVISSLLPSSADEGAAGFTLTVIGSAFVSGAVVRWDGSDRTTNFVDSATLEAVVL